MITIQAGYAVVIDDEPANRDFLERLLQTAGFKVSGAGSGADGLRACRSVPQLALAFVDQELPDAKGLEIISQLRGENPDALLVMATMHDDRNLIDEAFATGVDVFLVKPHGFMELYRRLQEVDNDTSLLRRVIIDQYGPRPYRGAMPKESAIPVSRPDEEVTRPAAPARISPDDPTLQHAPKSTPAPVAPATPASPAVTPTPVTSTPVVPVTTPITTTNAVPATIAETAPSTSTTPLQPAVSTPATPPVTPTVATNVPSTALPTPSPIVPAATPASSIPASPVNAAPVAASNTTGDKPAETPAVNKDGEKDSEGGDSHTDVTIPRRPKDLNFDPKPM